MRGQLGSTVSIAFWAGRLIGAWLLVAIAAGRAEGRSPGEEPLPDLARFQHWAQVYSDTQSESTRSGLVAEGVRLVKDRKQSMLRLMQADPRAAMSNSLPVALRRGIPREISSELEVPILGVGSLSVVCLLGREPGPEFESLQRYLTIEGRTFRAYSPNPAATETTRALIALRGISLDSAMAYDLAGGGSGSSAQPTGIQTARRLLIVRVDFPDLEADPDAGVYSCALLESVLDSQVVPFFKRSSYGKMAMTYVVTPRIYRLPQTASYYATADVGYQLNADARVQLAGDYDLGKYDSLVVVFPWLGNFSGSLITYGGMSEISGGNVWINGEFDFRVLVHELAHNCGLSHANLWQVNDGYPLSAAGWNVEFGDPFDPMGANWFNDQRVDFNPWSKTLLGWLTEDQAPTVISNGTYRLHRFDDSLASGTLALKVRKDGLRNYWIGWRGNFQDNQSLRNGAYIIWGYNLRQPSHLLDLTTPGAGAADSALELGATLIDSEAALTITPICTGGTPPNDYLDIEILFGFSDPTFVQNPQDKFVLAGQAVTFETVISGNPPPGLQWQQADAAGLSWNNVVDGPQYQGCSQSSLTIPCASLEMTGKRFRCVATGMSGQTLISTPAQLSVFTAEGPNLGAQCSGGLLVLSWSNLWTDYVLESSSQLGSEACWATVAGSAWMVNGMNYWTNRDEGIAAFFRLHKE